MSWEAALPKLKERLETLKTTHGLKVVIAGLPTNVQHDPFIYFYFDSFADISQGQIQGSDFNVAIVLATAWQDNERSELELAGLIDAVPPLFHARANNAAGQHVVATDEDNHPLPTLGGTVSSATLMSGLTARMPDERFPYRAVQFTLRVRDKGG